MRLEGPGGQLYEVRGTWGAQCKVGGEVPVGHSMRLEGPWGSCEVGGPRGDSAGLEDLGWGFM